MMFRPPPPDSEVAAEMYVDELLDGSGDFQYLDIPGSVSGLIRFELIRDLSRNRQILLPKEGSHGS